MPGQCPEGFISLLFPGSGVSPVKKIRRSGVPLFLKTPKEKNQQEKISKRQNVSQTPDQKETGAGKKGPAPFFQGHTPRSLPRGGITGAKRGRAGEKERLRLLQKMPE
jgi:hypothetical protein